MNCMQSFPVERDRSPTLPQQNRTDIEGGLRAYSFGTRVSQCGVRDVPYGPGRCCASRELSLDCVRYASLPRPTVSGRVRLRRELALTTYVDDSRGLTISVAQQKPAKRSALRSAGCERVSVALAM